MRPPILILLGVLAIVGGLTVGALMGIVVIGLIVGLLGAAIIVLAGCCSGRTTRPASD